MVAVLAPTRNGHAPDVPLADMLACPACGSPRIYNRRTRRYAGGIWRRTGCAACRHTWASLELPIPRTVARDSVAWIKPALAYLTQALTRYGARERPLRNQAQRTVTEVVAARLRGRTLRNRPPADIWRDRDWAARQISRLVGDEPFYVLALLYRLRAGRSRNGLAKDVGVDPSYLCRIERDERQPPRRHIVLALARGLQLTEFERDQLLVAGGYAPECLLGMGWTRELQEAVALTQGGG